MNPSLELRENILFSIVLNGNPHDFEFYQWAIKLIQTTRLLTPV